MAFRSTAKQRLWLECLGYHVPSTADSSEVQSFFDDASASHRYDGPPTKRQRELAAAIAVNIENDPNCREVAGRLYQVLLLNAWVYSVWRALTGEKAGTYHELLLPVVEALKVAREMNSAGMFAHVESFATTDGREADVFYRMSKGAKASPAFAFAANRLPASRVADQPDTPDTTWADSESQLTPLIQRRPVRAQRGIGCLSLFVWLFIVAASCIVGTYAAEKRQPVSSMPAAVLIPAASCLPASQGN